MQGKSNKQYEDSARAVGLASIALIAIMLVLGGMEFYKHCEHHYWSKPDSVNHQYWIPSEADKLWLDSLYEQVKRTEDDVIDLNESVNRIDRKIDEIILDRIEDNGMKKRNTYE